MQSTQPPILAKIGLFAASLLTITALSACGSSSSPGSSGGAGSPGSGGNAGNPNGIVDSPVPRSEFAMANGCYALQDKASGLHAAFDDAGALKFTRSDLATAHSFYMRPTTLGEYLFYTEDRQFMSAAGTGVVVAADPSDDTVWAIDYNALSDEFEVALQTTGAELSVDSSGNTLLVTADSSNTRFKFVPHRECAQFPEMPMNVEGVAFKGRGVDQPIVGFADVHSHLVTASETSLRGEGAGPTFGGGIFGQPAHRFGVEHAMDDCTEFHGEGGRLDPGNVVTFTPGAEHDTKGWPTFADWPKNDNLTHLTTYYRWVERAWMAGMRVNVNMTSNLAPACDMIRTYRGMPNIDCNDMNITRKQIQYTYEIQDYIDAQWGGPGKGWWRVVKTPQEAREVINDGKLAIILATEVAQLFDCTLDFDAAGNEISGCTKADIDEQMDELWDLGVRYIMPYHDVDTALGGMGLFGSGPSVTVLNYWNFSDTGRFWVTEECREYDESEPTVSDPGFEGNDFQPPPSSGDPVFNLFFDTLNSQAATAGGVPAYPPGANCNARLVSDLGDYAMRRMMRMGFVLDIDHSSYHSKDIMLDIADDMDPPYTWISTHSAQGGMTADQAARLIAGGGLIYPYKENGEKYEGKLNDLRFWRQKAGVTDADFPLALGMGVDPNGVGGHDGPRSTNNIRPITYPITLFQGEGWGPQFDGIEPVQVNMLTIPESGKFWHIDEVGQAHYGMVADYVEEVRLEAGEEGLNALFRSAEDFIRVWERVYYREANR